MKEVTLHLPDFWATALFYDDASPFGVLACNVHEYTFYENYGNPKTSAMTTLAHTME
jgi:superoxide dismutase